MKIIIQELNEIFTKKQKVQFFCLLLLIIGGAFWELLGVSAIVPFVQSIMDPSSLLAQSWGQFIYENLRLESESQFVICMAAVLIIVYIVKNIYLCIMAYFQYKFSFSNEYKLSQQMLANYINRPYEYHLHHGSAELIRNIRDDTAGCYSFVLCVLQMLSEVVVCIVLAVYLLIQDKSITIGIVLILLGYVSLYTVGVRTYIKKLGQRERSQIQRMNKWIVESLGGIKETKILQREKYFLNRYREDTDGLGKTQTRYSIISYISKPVVETLCIVGLLLVVSLKIYRGVNASYFIPIVSVFAVAAFRLLPSINRITNSLSMIMFRKPSVDALYKDLTDMKSLFMEVESEKGKKELNFEEKICLRDVSFHYMGSEKDVLKNVNLEIPKNKSIALIGPSGEGKTTLADLFLGLLEPQTGHILVDGTDINECKAEWYDKLGYIPQSIFLLDDTLKNNIAFGIPEDEIDYAKLQYAMDEAQISEYVNSLPERLETMVGERGVRLSGGQRQRIGIARALYKNPDILVLDEATSALDNDTEEAVMQAIDSLGGKKTLIIIAHRLSTIKNCDIVYKVSNKTVIPEKERTDSLNQ